MDCSIFSLPDRKFVCIAKKYTYIVFYTESIFINVSMYNNNQAQNIYSIFPDKGIIIR